MADLKISQLPTASSLANTDLIPVKTTAGTKAITFEDLKGSQEGYFKRVIDDYMAFDYEDLATLRAGGELIAGATYLLTDYQTVYKQSRPGQTPDYADKVSAVEPLVLTAISTDEFSSIAYSPAYPQDVIWYNFDNVLSPNNTTVFYSSVDRISKGFKGIIIRRIDTQKNINYSYDWRTMKWWREGNEVLTFADLDNTYNIVSGNNCYDNTFGFDCYNNTFGGGCYRNTFGDICYDNTFGTNCYNNTFGTNCYNNTFSSFCYNNTFGSECRNNTFGNSCYRNTFGNYLKNADVKSGFGYATVTNSSIYNKDYNHTFYIDSAGNKKCYCINSSGAITDVPLQGV
jgi:hypothetical protein